MPPSGLSIIVPVHNGVPTLERCLQALMAQVTGADEVIVVDDGSTDDPASVAKRHGAAVLTLDAQSGVSAARNRGAAIATRPTLFFVDSDVVLHADALARVRTWMDDASVDAVIGSYDDYPDAPTIVSRFKNLAHHYFHQRAAGPIASFWGACGAIRREMFFAVGGFDEQRFSRPSIEDVELGWRLAEHGAHIMLDPALQVTHLKRWTLMSLIETDIARRAIPWVRFSVERRRPIGDLNTSPLQQVGAVVAALFVASAGLSLVLPAARVALVILGIVAALINLPLFQLFWRRGGLPLLVGGFFLQQLYYLCALTGLVLGLILCWRPGGGRVPAPSARRG